MTTKEAKAWLARGWNLNIEIDTLEKLKGEVYRSLTSGIAKPQAAPGGSGGPHKFDRYAELAATIDARIDELVAVREEILHAINE